MVRSDLDVFIDHHKCVAAHSVRPALGPKASNPLRHQLWLSRGGTIARCRSRRTPRLWAPQARTWSDRPSETLQQPQLVRPRARYGVSFRAPPAVRCLSQNVLITASPLPAPPERLALQPTCQLSPSESGGMRLVPARDPAHGCTHPLIDIARYRASSRQLRCSIGGLAYWSAACLATSVDEVNQGGMNAP